MQSLKSNFVLVKRYQARSNFDKISSETPFEKSRKKSIFSFNIGQKKVDSDEQDFNLLVQRYNLKSFTCRLYSNYKLKAELFWKKVFFSF